MKNKKSMGIVPAIINGPIVVLYLFSQNLVIIFAPSLFYFCFYNTIMQEITEIQEYYGGMLNIK